MYSFLVEILKIYFKKIKLKVLNDVYYVMNCIFICDY